MRGCVVRVWCRRAAGCRAGRPFSGGRHGHVARRRVFGARVSGARASGARDAVKDKYEKETVTVDAPRYQVVLVETNLGSADM